MEGEADRACRGSSLEGFALGVGVLLLGVLLQGCANLSSIHRSDSLRSADTAEAHLTFIDAKQRAILSGTRYDPQIAAHGPATKSLYARFKTFCAEPSPDALSAYAAALSGSGSFQPSAAAAESIKGLVSAAFGEQSGSIGLRTQSITLLRDSMFRTCESYLNRALNEHQVNVLHRRFQSLMVALMGIEQLTGPLAAAQLALKNSAQTGFSGDPVKQAEALQSAYTRLENLKKEHATAQSKSEEDSRLAGEAQKKYEDYVASKGGTVTNDEKAAKEKELNLPTLRANKAKSEKALADVGTSIAQQNQVIALLMNPVSPSSANVAGDAEFSRNDRQPVSTQDITKVAEAITSIVTSTQLNNFVSDECLAYFGARSAALPKMTYNETLETICTRLFEDMGSYYKVQAQVSEAQTAVIRAQAAAISTIAKAAATAIEKGDSNNVDKGLAAMQNALAGVEKLVLAIRSQGQQTGSIVRAMQTQIGTNTLFREVTGSQSPSLLEGIEILGITTKGLHEEPRSP